mmetsp:Transcript_7611/g.15828  ORF Transcript_7611/g.15828 Transcript_7611/m.15828 type:complete len:584 (-) Transcript_7611:133-1884(-)
MSHRRRLLPVLLSVLWSSSFAPYCAAFVFQNAQQRSVRSFAVTSASSSSSARAAAPEDEYDVVVIGSGVGGLSCGGCLSSAGLRVLVLESHDSAGGAAHEWEVGGYRFESGPSLYAGLSGDRSPNPLAHVFDAVGERPAWIRYDRWGTHLPEGSLLHDAVGAEDFVRKLAACGGPDAGEQWERLMRRVVPLGEAIFRLPSAAVRMDPWVALTMGRYLPALADVLIKAGGPAKLEMPFSDLLDEEDITDPFIRNWLDMICFLLQGATTRDAPVTLMAYMLTDFYKPGVVLDYPKGGSRAIVDALVRGVTKHDGCHVELNAHVAELLVENGRAAGVRTRDGRTIRARRAVVSNADLWSTRRLVDAATAPDLAAQLDARLARVERCDSFLHLHVGIDGAGLPAAPTAAFPAQWAALDDWAAGVDAPRNLVLVSMASLLDPSLAPPGCHVLHAYVPATEPYADWEGMDRASPEYRKKKEEAAGVLWAAIERQIPDVRERAKVTLIGTPLTHERFLRRDRGTYGPFLRPKDGMLDGQATCLDGFLCCGDSTFPGIGMPAVAASGMICANTIVSVADHWKMLDKIRLPQ